MSDGLVLWGRASSVNVQKVLWALDELGLEYTHRLVGGKYGGFDRADFRAVSPLPRVPVLEDGGEAIWESHAILRHLARRAGQLGKPETEVDIWMEFASTTLQPPFIGLFWQRVRRAPVDRDAVADAAHLEAMTRALAVIDGALADGRSHLAGDAFSLADIAAGSMMHRIAEIAPETLDAHLHVATWAAHLARRPAYTRSIATSYEDLRAPA